MKILRVGVVGTGHLGKLHALLYNNVKNAELIGVFDVDRQKAEEVAREAKTRAFPSFQELLQAVEAVNIVVPTVHHFALASEALEQGKHLFIEKPITKTPEEAGELAVLAQRQGCTIQVGHIERFNQAVRAVQQVPVHPMFIESHRLAPFNPRGTDVAVILDLMIHDIDLILGFVDSPIAHIAANGVAVISEEPDIANARISFQNGCVANVTASRISQKRMRKMRLFERDTYISIDFLEGISERFYLEAEIPQRAGETAEVMGKMEGQRTRYICYEKLQAPEGNALEMELRAFVDAVLQHKPPQVTADEAKLALEVANQINKIIKEQNSNLG